MDQLSTLVAFDSFYLFIQVDGIRTQIVADP